MRSLGLVALVVTLCAAGRVSAKEVKPPAELFVTLALGSDKTLDGARAYVDAVAPGAGAQMAQGIRQGLAEAVGMQGFDGLDTSASLYVLVVDGGGVKGAALFGKVSDETKLDAVAGTAKIVLKQGWALVGAKPVVAKVTAYAFGTLAGAPEVTMPTATVFTKGMLTRYKKRIADGRAGFIAGVAQLGEKMGSMYDAGVGTLGDSDKLIATLDVSKDAAAIDLALLPRAGTRLAKFVATQKASDYALLDKLPAGTGNMMMIAGHLEAGPYRQGMLELFTSLAGTMPKEMVAMWSEAMAASSGDVAVVGQFGVAMTMTQVFGMSDRKRFDAAIDKLSALLKDGRTFETLGVKSTIKTASATEYNGASLRSFDIQYDLSAATATMKQNMEKMIPGGKTSQALATTDQVGVVVIGPDSGAQIKMAVDASRGKGKSYKLSSTVASFIASSLTRKESIAMVMDFGAMMKLPMAVELMMSLGFADGSAHFRVTLRPEVLRVFMQKKSNSGASSGPS